MDTLALHLVAGSDLRRSLELLARQEGGQGFVLSVVGNLSMAVFQCPGRAAPTQLSGELEIITLSGSLSPQGVHLHLSVSDADCRVWGGHLEPGTLVLRGADLLVGFLPVATASTEPPAATARPLTSVHAPSIAAATPYAAYAEGRQPRPASPIAPAQLPPQAITDPQAPRLEIAVLDGCPWSARALRLLRTLSIPHQVVMVDSDAVRAGIQQRSGSTSLPQVFVDGEPIGGYDALVESHARRELEPLRLV